MTTIMMYFVLCVVLLRLSQSFDLSNNFGRHPLTLNHRPPPPPPPSSSCRSFSHYVMPRTKLRQNVLGSARILSTANEQAATVFQSRSSSRLGMALSEDADSESTSKTLDVRDASWVSSPLDRPLLAVVDAMALLLFAIIGRSSHSELTSNALDDVVQTLSTVAPFWISWFVTSPITGVYRNEEPQQRQQEYNQNSEISEDLRPSNNLIWDSWSSVVPGWIVAIPLGCVLRGIIKGYVPPLPFVIVTLISTLVILGFFRVIFSIVEDFFVELV